MPLTFTAEQSRILEETGSSLIVGAPGSGKTLLLIEKAARLAKKANDGEVVVLGFSFRSVQFIKNLFEKRHKALAPKVRFMTMKDCAAELLAAAEGRPVPFADNGEVRRLLREAMQQENFKGTLGEAEHVIRTFRAQLKNPSETDRHVPLFNRYKGLLEQTGQQDRHMIIRQHIIGMDNGTVPLCPAKYMLIDNVQDATPLQCRWLQTHLSRQVIMTLAGNDDLTAFGRDGAMGMAIFDRLEKKGSLTRYTLNETHRVAPELWPAVGKIPRLLRQRMAKKENSVAKGHGQLLVQECGTQGEEMTFVMSQLERFLKSHQKGRVGVILRQDEQASRFVHLLRLRGVNPASYARPIWENQGAKVVLDLLYVMLNSAQNSQLFNVMSFMGIPVDIQAQLVEKSLDASSWLAHGAPLPQGLKGDVHQLGRFRRNLLSTWQLLQQKKIRPPEAFKALVHDMLPSLSEEDRRMALLALDMLMNVKGNMLKALPTIQQETLPDMRSRVVVAPVREVRNMEFDHVILPFAEAMHWPNQQEALLGPDEEGERRLFYLATSRTKGSLICTYSDQLSAFVKELQSSLKMYKKPSAG